MGHVPLVRCTNFRFAFRAAVCVLILCLSVFASHSASAATFNFFPVSSSGDGSLGTNSYTTPLIGSNYITVTGFQCTSIFGGGNTGCLSGGSVPWWVNVNRADLYEKNDGANELGLGLTRDADRDHEISSDSFIDLDLTHLGATTGTLTISSLQAGESYLFCYGNSNSGWNSNSCSALQTGTTGTNMNVAFNLNAYHDISLIGVNNDVLLASVTTSPAATPEPGSLALLGTGLLSVVGVMKRRLMA